MLRNYRFDHALQHNKVPEPLNEEHARLIAESRARIAIGRDPNGNLVELEGFAPSILRAFWLPLLSLYRELPLPLLFHSSYGYPGTVRSSCVFRGFARAARR